MQNRLRQIMAGCLLVLCIPCTRGDDSSIQSRAWTQFRGPGGQGHAGEASVPISWSEKKNVVWKTALPGRGHSSPVVWGQQIWMTTASPDGQALGALCCHRETGELIHRVTIFRPDHIEEIHPDNTYASPTPVIEAGRLYVDFGTYGAACLDTKTADILWTNQTLTIEHQGGPGSSPVLFQDRLIVHRDGADQQYVAALDKNTGRLLWKRKRSAPFRNNPITHRAFATPLLAEFDGDVQLISPAADQIHAYDPLTGKERWHVRYIGFSTVPCPVAADGVTYFCTGFFKPRLMAVRMDGTGDVTNTHVLWSYRAQVPDTPSPILVDGFLYFVSNKGIATCLEAKTGKRVWVKRLGGNYSASPIYAGGHLYFCSEEGITRVLKPGKEPNILQTNRLHGTIMASPIAVDGALYIRTEQALYRIEDSGS